MVGQGGSRERKTAYFYERIPIDDQNVSERGLPCDPLFLKALETSTFEIGEKYQSLMKQRQPFLGSYGKISTRRGDCQHQFIDTSDDETVVPVDD